MTATIDQALDTLIEHWHNKYTPAENWPATAYAPQWPSPCYQHISENHIVWRPVRQDTSHDMFQRLGEALDLTFHPDIIHYYSRYWSDPIDCRCEDGQLSLLQPWSEQDLERLRGNLLGHLLQQQRQKQPLSIFFATTEDPEGMLCLRNDSGEVWFELPGKAVRCVSPSLAEFIAQLEID